MISRNSYSYKATDNTAGTLGLKPGDDCPKCGGELMRVNHDYQSSGGAPDCAWLWCQDCNYETDPE